MFQVYYDRVANCLNITVEGFWTPEDVPPFARRVQSQAVAAAAIRADFNAHIESLNFPVQATDVAELLAGIMGPAMALTTGRAAVVVGSQLNKAQAERTLIHPRLRVFMTVEDAHAWLVEAVER